VKETARENPKFGYYGISNKIQIKKNKNCNVKAQGGGIKFTKNTNIRYMIWYGMCVCSHKSAFSINEDLGP
jgi:hypothetical protein